MEKNSKMISNKKEINTVLVQYYPNHKDINGNIAKIEKLLEKYKLEDNIDIVLLPEMALTGYIFDSIEDIHPLLEEYNKGLTYEFCKSIAKRLNCYVFCGYPEKCTDPLDEAKWKYYNSCMIVNRDGSAVPSTRKHHLYCLDKTWCIESEEFGYFEIFTRNNEKIKLGIGICMDLSNYEFTAPWGNMELANFCLKKDVDLILFLTNWIDTNPEDNSEENATSIIDYWLLRLEPYVSGRQDRKHVPGKPVYFLAANRVGKEISTTFIGCSCVLKLCSEPLLLYNLNKQEEATIFANLKF